MKKATFLVLAAAMFLVSSCANEATETTCEETCDTVQVIESTVEFTTEDSLQIESEIAE
jgi:hypothetical protein